VGYGDPTITVVGNLADDPRLDYTPAGRPVAKLRIIVNTRTKQGDKYVDGQPSVYNAVIWGELGEHVAECLTKGVRVIAQGTWGQTKPYEDKNGSTIYPWELNIQAIGPDLRFVAVEVKRLARASSGSAPAGGGHDDPWATGQ
jgi:single-strand DNA-binding protein